MTVTRTKKSICGIEKRAVIAWTAGNQFDSFETWQMISNWFYGYGMALEVANDYEAADIAEFLRQLARARSLTKESSLLGDSE